MFVSASFVSPARLAPAGWFAWWRAHFTELGVRHAYEGEDAMQIKRGVAAEQDHVVGTASVGCAFFGEPDLTAKLVLILREHRCRVTEALLVKNKWVVNSVADMVRRAEPQRHIFKSDQQPSILDLKNQGSC